MTSIEAFRAPIRVRRGVVFPPQPKDVSPTAPFVALAMPPKYDSETLTTVPPDFTMPDKPHYAMAFDLERCTGCHACSVACKVENDVPLGNFRTKVYYYDQGKYPSVRRSFLPVVCLQCADAPCLKACPTESITRGEDGIVRINTSTCEGYGKCEDACPYDAIYVDPVRNIADKCNFCEHRLAVGMEPACVETCPGETIVFGDLNDPDSRISRFRAKHGDTLVVLKNEEQTQPQVQYRGLDRALEKKIPKGRNHDPRSYEIENWAKLQATFDGLMDSERNQR